MGCTDVVPLELKQKQAIEFIQESEGLRLKAYRDSNGHWIIGYGTRSHQGEVITKKEAHRRMQVHLKPFWKYIPEDLSIGQYTAYTSLVYNLGYYKARNLLVTKLDCKKILLYDKVNGKKHKGITIRRQREYELCVR